MTIFSNENLILQLDREVTVFLADQRLDAKNHAWFKNVIETVRAIRVGINDRWATRRKGRRRAF